MRLTRFDVAGWFRSLPLRERLTKAASRRSTTARSVEQLESRRVLFASGAMVNYLPSVVQMTPSSGLLSDPQAGDPLDIAMSFLRNNAAELGVEPADLAQPKITDGYRDVSSGTTYIYLKQQFNGLEVENAALNTAVTASGSVITVGSSFVSGLASLEGQPGYEISPTLTPVSALQSITDELGLPDSVVATVTAQSGLDQAAVVTASKWSLDPIPVHLEYVATDIGLRLTWSAIIRTTDGEHWYDAHVDAESGELLWLADWMEDLAAYNIVPVPAEHPLDGGRTVLVNPASPTYSPYGWHDSNGAAGAEFTDTRGNNVFAQEDIDNNDTGGIRPSGGASLQFDFPLDLSQAPSVYRSAAITNLFYVNNLLHDVHAAYGFTEAAGNFQLTNYSGQGQGGDPVIADAQDGSGTNNANFGTPPDGFAPRMQQYLFTLTSPQRDSDLDNGVIIHEYGHGVSTRLTGGPANSSALDALQSGGMGEGWSDFWALMFTQRATDSKNSGLPIGTYVLGQASNGRGFRTRPYSFNMTTDPHTWADYNSVSTEVHYAGEIWASALWDLNWLLIDKYGFDADLATGYTAGGPGNKLALQLVMDGLKLQPANPSFINARDAIIAADVALTGGANQREIWTAFARRGLGSGASTSSSEATTVTTSFSLPTAFDNPGVIDVGPAGKTNIAPSSLDIVFSEAMDQTSFSTAADIQSFTGPGGSDLLNQITGFTWQSSTTLRINFNTQVAEGAYSLTFGPNILSNDTSTALDQDGDETSGESTQDQFTARFEYDAAPLQVTSINPPASSTVDLPVTSVTVNFSEPFDVASVSANDLQVSQGTVTGVSVVDADTLNFTLSGLAAGPLYVNLKYGAVRDTAGFANEFYAAAISLLFETDFGDAPDSYGTLTASNGVVHRRSSLYLGTSAPDVELDGQPNATANGDGADEDGVVLSRALVVGTAAALSVTSSASGELDYFFDFDQSGVFGDQANEIFSATLVAGTQTLTPAIPANAVTGLTYARFRLSSFGGLGPNGSAFDGEVEDYAVTIYSTSQSADFGDAPDGIYATLSESIGPSHGTAGPQLGASRDADTDGQQNSTATGDGADEDGVTFPQIFAPGATVSINVTSSAGGGQLNAFFDWDRDGVFGNTPSELVSASLTGGTQSISVMVPSATALGVTYARFRLSSVGGLSPLGFADDGEVEDYQLLVARSTNVVQSFQNFDSVTAPALPSGWNQSGAVAWVTASGALSNSPPNHAFVSNSPTTTDNLLTSSTIAITLPSPQLKFRNNYDTEFEYDGGVLEISINGGAFTDIISAGGSFVTGGYDAVLIAGSALGGRSTWTGTSNGYIDTLINLPAAVVNQSVQFRWRLATDGGVGAVGWRIDDIQILGQNAYPFDFGDAPDPSYPTRITSSGAAHLAEGALTLGASIDAESDGQANAAATGDDINNTDDENGITLPSTIRILDTTTVAVNASGPGLLSAWIDFNDDGDWTDSGEQIFRDTVVSMGHNALTFVVPPSAIVTSQTFARFRLSTNSGQAPSGQAPDGEVEDYAVEIAALPSLVIDQSDGTTVVSEVGTTDTISIQLTAPITSNVVLNLGTSDSTEVTLNASTITFTPANWFTPQTIVVSGPEDAFADGNRVSSITISVDDAQSDDIYDSLADVPVSVLTLDNESIGFSVVESNGQTSVSESGTTDSFTVVLNGQPESDVVITVVSSDVGEAVVSVSQLTFISANWDTPQTVTVTGVDEALVDGPQTANIMLSISDAASYDPFDSLADQTLNVTIANNDVAGFTVVESSGQTSVTEVGSSDSFTVVLNAQPLSDVVIAVSNGDASEVSVNVTTLTFAAANWNMPQTVSVSGVNDNVDDGDASTAITFSIDDVASNDFFDSVADQTISVTTVDDDTNGFVVLESNGATSVTEAGSSDTFTVVLNAQPLSNVLITVLRDDSTEASVAPMAVTFTPGNWNVAQTVTVTGVDDLMDDGDVVSTISLSIDDANSDDSFDGVADQFVNVTTIDDDDVGFVVVPSDGDTTVSEAGTSDSLTVRLTAQPMSDVVISVTSGDLGEVTANLGTLTFNGANWNVAQIVTITGVDDAPADGDQTTAMTLAIVDALSDDSFDAVPNQSVSVTNFDDEVVGFSISETAGTTVVNETGTQDSFGVVLTAEPLGDVVIDVTSDDPTEVSINLTSLIFTSGNWNVAQTVTVTGLDDLTVDGTVTSHVTLSIAADASHDSYDLVANQIVSVATVSDDLPGVLIQESDGSTAVSESGTTDLLSIVLTSQPLTNVVFQISSNDSTEVSAAPSSITFTPSNWNIAQSITVQGVDDGLVDGNQTSSLTISVNDVGSDDAWDSLADTLISITNTDDEIAGFVVTQSGGSTTVGEAGSTDTFTVKLAAQPLSNVVISVAASDATEASINKTLLTFTPSNWDTVQTVTVTGMNDGVVDGAITSTVTLKIEAAATDDAFDSVTSQAVTVTTNDDDVAGFQIVQTGGNTTVSENATTDSFSVTLLAAPLSDVVLTVVSSNVSEATVSVSSLTFTPSDWNTPQTVLVTGVDDVRVDGSQTTFVTLSIDDAASNDFFDDVANQTVAVTTTDNDQAGFSVVASDGSTDLSESGTSDTLSVVLTAQPLTDVVIQVVASDGSEATANFNALTFTPADWTVAQTVTLIGVNDSVVDGDVTSSVRFTIDDNTSDNFFDPLLDQLVDVLTVDDEVAGFLVSQLNGNTVVSEDETLSDSVSVTLTAEPLGNVVIAVTASNSQEATVETNRLTFTPANWNVAQVVTVTGVDDTHVDGTLISSIRFSVDDAQSQDLFDAVADQSIDVSTIDNDVAGFVVTPTGGSTVVSENGTTDSVSVTLTAQPLSDVVIEVTSSDSSEVSITPAMLIFSATNWNVPQVVTLLGINDPTVDGAQISAVQLRVTDALSDDAWDSVADQTFDVSTTDNDTPGFSVIQPGSNQVSESGTSNRFGLMLTAQPVTNVVLRITNADAGEVSVSPNVLTFTPANWDQQQQVTFAGIDDIQVDGSQTTTLDVSIDTSLSDDGFDGVVSQSLNVITLDDDLPGFNVVTTNGSTQVSEAGGTDEVTVQLTAQPLTNVVISATLNNALAAAAQPQTLTFTPANWNVPQTVTVTAKNNAIVDGTRISELRFAVVDAASSEPFRPLQDQIVEVQTLDDDSAEFSVSGGVVTEGGSVTFTLNLSAPVSLDSTVAISTADGSATAVDGDYVSSKNRVVTVPAGMTSQTFTVVTNPDTRFEIDETFQVAVDSVQAIGRNVLLSSTQRTATGTITNDDAPATAPILSLDANGGLLYRDSVNQNDRLTITFDVPTQSFVFRDPNNDIVSTVGSTPSTHEVRVPRAVITGKSLIVELGGGADVADLSSVPAGLLAVRISGGAGNDVISGSLGADVLSGDDDNDIVSGFDGDDVLTGGLGADTLMGGVGIDTLREVFNADMVLTNASFKVSTTTTAAVFDVVQDLERADLTGGANRNRIDLSSFANTHGTTINGAGSNDVIVGSQGPDLITTISGIDVISGLGGDDTISSGNGNDTISGGAGNDFLYGLGGDDSILGEDGADQLLGNDGRDTLSGGADIDVIAGLAGDDLISGDDGNDVLYGNDGNDTITGGNGNDFILGQVGIGLLSGGEGNDTLIGHNLNDTLNGDGGIDKLFGFAGDDNLFGGAGDDSLFGDEGQDSLFGDAGADFLVGGAGNDRFDGGLDSDRINEVVDSNVVILPAGLNSSLLGSDTFVNLERVNLSGGSGNNVFDARQATVSVLLVGGDGNDTLLGGSRNDVLQGGTGDDVLSGGPGVDAVDGSDGLDFFYEKANANFTVIGTQVSSSVTGTETPLNIERIALLGGDGNNVLNAAQASVRVVLIGGRGNDTLIGSSQADTLSGGNRNDSTVAGSDGVDSLDGGLSSDLLEQDSSDQRVADNSDTVVANVFATLPNWIDAL